MLLEKEFAMQSKPKSKFTSTSAANQEAARTLTTFTNEEIRKALSFMAGTFTGYPELERIFIKMKSEFGE